MRLGAEAYFAFGATGDTAAGPSPGYFADASIVLMMLVDTDGNQYFLLSLDEPLARDPDGNRQLALSVTDNLAPATGADVIVNTDFQDGDYNPTEGTGSFAFRWFACCHEASRGLLPAHCVEECPRLCIVMADPS